MHAFHFLFTILVSDASGRYRGQFLFENNHWLGSIVACENLAKIDEMELSFYVATILIHSPEPMIKVCIWSTNPNSVHTRTDNTIHTIYFIYAKVLAAIFV